MNMNKYLYDWNMTCFYLCVHYKKPVKIPVKPAARTFPVKYESYTTKTVKRDND